MSNKKLNEKVDLALVPQEIIEKKIFLIRGKKVMLDRDLAQMYGVATKVLNQAVKRNMKRFPVEFMFQINYEEKNELVTNCDRLVSLKHSASLSYVFTEPGVAMLSSVLNSEAAINVNVQIIKTFVRLREIIFTHKELVNKLDKLEKRLDKKDEEVQVIFEAIHNLMEPPYGKRKRKIGFH
jgi:hypothetical protein